MNAFSAYKQCKYTWRNTGICGDCEPEMLDESKEHILKCRHRIITNVLDGKCAGILDDTLPYEILCMKGKTEKSRDIYEERKE